MDDKFSTYDQIISEAINWLIRYSNEYERDICISQIDWQDEEDLCILSILSWMPLIANKDIYYKGNIINYFILKYIKKFKCLKWYKFDMDVTEIRIHDFENALMIALNKHPSILADIYNEYYKR